MDALITEFAPTTAIPWQVIAARMVLAVVLGGVLGFEREMAAHPAGLRTHMLVCLACATFALVTLEIVAMPQFQGEHVRADPIRLVEAITAGVAFLAAGFIIFKGGAIRGLTTGAGMWLAAATGLAAGLGLWLVAVFACALGTAVMSLIRYIETGLDLKDPEKGHVPPEEKGRDRPGRP